MVTEPYSNLIWKSRDYKISGFNEAGHPHFCAELNCSSRHSNVRIHPSTASFICFSSWPCLSHGKSACFSGKCFHKTSVERWCCFGNTLPPLKLYTMTLLKHVTILVLLIYLREKVWNMNMKSLSSKAKIAQGKRY